MFSPDTAVEIVFAIFAFILGATVGSFLNVCIHRLPRNLSVNQPKRSFCPKCEKQIAWFHNLPLYSWLALRGKCAYCSSPIAVRYFIVELLTALLFLALWLLYPYTVAPVLWVFVALLIVATFIDFEWFIIPDEITWGCVGAGILLSTLVPAVQGELLWWRGGLQAGIGAAAGYFGLWAVVQLGKLAFGKKKVRFDEALPFRFEKSDSPENPDVEGEEWAVISGDERLPWSELFARESDELVIHCQTLTLDGRKRKETEVRARYNQVTIGEESIEEEDLPKLKGTMTGMIIPREAMGFGDVKFLAGIGAFLGWQGVLFTVFSSSIIGATIGILLILFRREDWGAKLPYGPYLSLGALLWLFGGKTLWDWYLASLQAPL